MQTNRNLILNLNLSIIYFVLLPIGSGISSFIHGVIFLLLGLALIALGLTDSQKLIRQAKCTIPTFTLLNLIVAYQLFGIPILDNRSLLIEYNYVSLNRFHTLEFYFYGLECFLIWIILSCANESRQSQKQWILIQHIGLASIIVLSLGKIYSVPDNGQNWYSELYFPQTNFTSDYYNYWEAESSNYRLLFQNKDIEHYQYVPISHNHFGPYLAFEHCFLVTTMILVLGQYIAPRSWFAGCWLLWLVWQALPNAFTIILLILMYLIYQKWHFKAIILVAILFQLQHCTTLTSIDQLCQTSYGYYSIFNHMPWFGYGLGALVGYHHFNSDLYIAESIPDSMLLVCFESGAFALLFGCILCITFKRWQWGRYLENTQQSLYSDLVLICWLCYWLTSAQTYNQYVMCYLLFFANILINYRNGTFNVNR